MPSLFFRAVTVAHVGARRNADLLRNRSETNGLTNVSGRRTLISEDNSFRGQPKNLKLAIEKSADDLGQPGTEPYYGRGRINVKTALGL